MSDDLCVMIMSVRKGKRLMGRLLPFLPAPQAAAVVMAIARNLPVLAKKDKQDQVTPPLQMCSQDFYFVKMCQSFYFPKRILKDPRWTENLKFVGGVFGSASEQTE